MLCWSSSAWGQEATPSADTQLAEQHFKRGYALVEAHDYEAAAAEFEQAYEKSPHHSVLYNLGQAYALAGKHVRAVQTLRRFLAQAEGADPELVARANSALHKSERHVGTLRLTVTPAATVTVDGQAVPQPGEPQILSVGTHGVWAQAAGYLDGYRSFTVTAGSVTQVELELHTGPSPPFCSPCPTYREPPPSRTWSYVLAGTGIALGAGAVALYLKSSADYRDTEDQLDLFVEKRRSQGELGQADRDEVASLMSESAKQQRWQDVAIGLGVGAGVSVGAAAYLFWKGSPRAEEHAVARLSFDGRRVSWRTQW